MEFLVGVFVGLWVGYLGWSGERMLRKTMDRICKSQQKDLDFWINYTTKHK